MKDEAHSPPFVALSFPDSKKRSFTAALLFFFLRLKKALKCLALVVYQGPLYTGHNI